MLVKDLLDCRKEQNLQSTGDSSVILPHTTTPGSTRVSKQARVGESPEHPKGLQRPRG